MSIYVANLGKIGQRDIVIQDGITNSITIYINKAIGSPKGLDAGIVVRTNIGGGIQKNMYDNNGNMVTESCARNFVYDDENRLVSVYYTGGYWKPG